jgi:hypothetical protein
MALGGPVHVANPPDNPVNCRILDSEGESYTTDNPLPTTDIDQSGRMSLNTVFGEKIVGTRVPTISGQFQYGLRSDDAVIDTVGTGAYEFTNSMLKVSTGTDSDGHIGVQGADYIRYIPGQQAWANFTFVFASPKENTIQKIGVFDYDGGNGNGFSVGYNGLTFGITRRRNGVDAFTAVDITTIFDDGSFDPTKGNVYSISYGYLGFATITFEGMNPRGGWNNIKKIQYPNTEEETHIGNTNIPLRVEMTNDGNTTDMVGYVGSVAAGIVDGGGADPQARWFSFSGGITAVTAGTTQLFTFRNKATFFSINNKISTQLALISAATESNKTFSWGIEKNATITTPGTWTDINTTDSVMEYSTNAVVTLGTGVDLLDWQMGRTDSFFEKVEDLIIKLRPNEWATIFVVAGGAGDVNLSMRWKELF